MKKLIHFALVLTFVQVSFAQSDVLTLSPENFSRNNEIFISGLDYWYFKPGNDISWAGKDLNMQGWQKLSPAEVSTALADTNGRLEGWFRIKVLLKDFDENKFIGLRYYSWGAADIYVDGKLWKRYGQHGSDDASFVDYNPGDLMTPAFPTKYGQVQTIAVHFTDYRSSLPPFELKSEDVKNRMFRFVGETYQQNFGKYLTNRKFYDIITITSSVLFLLLFLIIWMVNRSEVNLRNFALLQLIVFLQKAVIWYYDVPGTSYIIVYFGNLSALFLTALNVLVTLHIVSSVFNRSMPRWLKFILWMIVAMIVFSAIYQLEAVVITVYVLVLTCYMYYVVIGWRVAKGAQWAILIGLMTTIFLGFIMYLYGVVYGTSFVPFGNEMTIVADLAFPLSALVYIAIRFREIIGDVRAKADEVAKLSDEKRIQAENQQKILEAEVDRQTQDLKHTLSELQITQKQLIQSEKMASLGELTAGIAHEIQNPLNFVNNFSDVSIELLEEIEVESRKSNVERNYDLISEIHQDIKQNLGKIAHHGRRADSIVKGMLQHSRKSAGEKELTDINALTDEFLRLAYHGLRAKDKSFNVELETQFAEDLPKVNVVPQDIGRVLLNLFTNAFYATNQKQKMAGDAYKPMVRVITATIENEIEICVYDNGTGIPDSIKDKILQPFFTTKPTGEGTGLGLSLSYDIIKAHGGSIRIDSVEEKYSELILLIPIH